MSVRRRPEFLRVEPLKSSTFSEFGQVIERPVSGGNLINGGTAARFDGVARLDFGSDGGEPLLSLFEAEAARIPIEVRRLERHVGSSQMFVPLEGQRLLVIVAARGEQPDRSNVRCFLSDGRQGVNFDAGVWHHPLLALTAGLS
jgi:ureidoglycolate lyase